MEEWYYKNLSYLKLFLYIPLLVAVFILLLMKYVQNKFLKNIELDLNSDIDISSIDKSIAKYVWIYKMLQKLGLLVLSLLGVYGVSLALYAIWRLGEK